MSYLPSVLWTIHSGPQSAQSQERPAGIVTVGGVSTVVTKRGRRSDGICPTTGVDSIASGDSGVAAAFVALVTGWAPVDAADRGSDVGVPGCRHMGSLNSDSAQNDVDALFKD